MDSVVRALAVYGVLLLVFRISGKRSLAQITTFDAVLLLIISETVQQAMIDGDESMTNAFLLAITLLGADVLLSVLTLRSAKLDRLLNDGPLVIIEDGRMHEKRMAKARVSEDDILESARQGLGIERLDQVKYAILERNGGITVIPKEGALAHWTPPAG